MKTLENRIEIEFNKSKIIFLLLISSVFFIAGILIFVFGDRQANAAPGLRNAIAIAAIGFFGCTLIYGLKKYLNKKPALVLNHQGILDNASALAPVFIKWEEITGFNIAQVKRAKFVLIYVKDAEEFLDNASFFKRMMIQTNIQMYGTPISVAASDIHCNLDELVATIIKEQKKYQPDSLV